MKQLFETNKSVDEFVEKVQKIMPNYGFGLHHIHNPREKLQEKGLDFDKECKILDVCNAKIAYGVLSKDLSLSCIMPCKIAVYNENGQTTIALNSIVQMMDDLNPDFIELAQETQEMLVNIINDSC